MPDIPVLYSLPVAEHDHQTESYHEQTDQEAQTAQYDTVKDKVCYADSNKDERTYEENRLIWISPRMRDDPCGEIWDE